MQNSSKSLHQRQHEFNIWLKRKIWSATMHNCECGGKYNNHGKSQHFKTLKHLKWLEDQQSTNSI